MVQGRELWLECRVDPANQQALFCTRLRGELQRLAKLPTQQGLAGPDGAMAARVTVTRTGAASADALLEAGALSGGGLRVVQSQSLRIDVSDANFGAGSATALVYPLTKLLGL